MAQRAVRVLVTGAYGLIGNLVFAHLADLPQAYEPYGMVRRPGPSNRAAQGTVHRIPEDRLRLATLGDLPAMQRAVEGMDVVVHMAAVVEGNKAWEDVLESNIVGAYNLFEASRLAGVGRVVFASTNQVVFGYRNEEPYKSFLAAAAEGHVQGTLPPLRHDQPVRPTNLYACSKVFGEALAHMYACTYGMSCICLRIGWVTADDVVSRPFLWCSRRDVVQLVQLAIEAPASLRFDVVFGHSDNENNLVDISHTEEALGYLPQDGKDRHGNPRLAR